MAGIPDQPEGEPSYSRKLRRTTGRVSRGHVQEISNKSDSFVHDQIIIAPEIMSIILEKLDLRSLKKCRLVCKSWLEEAQPHFERRTVVRFKRNCYTGVIKSFNETRQKQLLRTLPQPFRSLDVDLWYSWGLERPYKLCLKQLQGLLRFPLLVLTRFSPADVPLDLTLPLIIKCSSSLEYLKLQTGSCEAENLRLMGPEQKFPKLGHINTKMWAPEESTQTLNFATIIAWIVNASPNLKTFESTCVGTRSMEIGSEVLLNVKIENVRSLILSGYNFNKVASEHFLSRAFSRLEYLELQNIGREARSWGYPALIATVMKSADTLKNLDMSKIVYHDQDKLETSKFPTCHNVNQLTLTTFGPYWMRNISNNFPSLRILNVKYVDADLLGDSWTDLPPFSGIKTLRTACYSDNDEQPIKFLEKFPELERLRLDVNTLLDCCRLITTGDPRFSNMFNSVKHLELQGKGLPGHENDASLLIALRGIETITMTMSNHDISLIPFQDLPSLKAIQFPWGDCVDLDKLQEMARRVEKVVVINCCSVPRFGGQQSNNLLNKFFDSASNVECGCGKYDSNHWK